MTTASDAWTLSFGAMSLEDGFALREARETRYFPGSDPNRFRHLLTIGDLDAFLRSDAGAGSNVSMADGTRKGSAAVPDELYTHEDGRPNLANLFELFDKGATLVVSQFHDKHPPLASYCRGLEQAFRHAVQSNIYLTPAGAQGFRIHYDTHDVLVLQVTGEKRWKIWEGQPVPDPTKKTPWDTSAGIKGEGEPQLVTMKPGDVLYIPRGVLHEAAAQDGADPSLHITVGLLEPCWADAMRVALDIVEEREPTLRRAFPTWRIGEPGIVEDLVDGLAMRLEELADDALIDQIAMRFMDRLARDRMPLLARGLLQRTIGAGDRMRLADTLLHQVVVAEDGTAALRWTGGVEPLSQTEIQWLAALDEGAAARELGGDEALAFVRKLYAKGLLTEAPGAPHRQAAE